MTHRFRRGVTVLALVAGATTTFTLFQASPASAATNISFSLATGGAAGIVYIDAEYGDCDGNSIDGSGYDAGFDYTDNGQPGSMVSKAPWNMPPTEVPNPGSGCSGKTLSQARIEVYPLGNAYNPWTGNVGGIHAQQSKSVDGNGFATFGQIPLPTVGVNGAFRITGDIVSSTSRNDGRVIVDLFQIGCGPPDTCPPLQSTSTGAAVVGGFTTGSNKGMAWTGSVSWPGHYIVFIEDKDANRKVHGFMEIAEGSVPAIDLDMACFGLHTCIYDTLTPLGAPRDTNIPNPKGGFHPLPPTRILDTRVPLGIVNGAMRPGDGRSPAVNAFTRRSETQNHELKVTGLAGIPLSGVSAVLINLTAVDPNGDGWVSVFPRPPAVGDIFDDQATYGAFPETSNLNLTLHETAPNLVLARVGAGGTIRFWYAGSGDMHIIADVAGWFDTSAPSTSRDRLGFTPVTPKRLLDTRQGVGDTVGRYRAGDDRAVQITGDAGGLVGVTGVPVGAKSVVLNITATGPSGWGYVTAYPDDGSPAPVASNLNLNTGVTRANLVVVKLGTNGKIRLAGFVSDVDLIVDVFGYYGTGGGLTTPVNPVRAVDTRLGIGTPSGTFGPGETRNVKLTNTCPAGTTAVILNVTAGAPTEGGYLTVWPAGIAQPTSSNLNFPGGTNIPNAVIVGVDANGFASIYNFSGALHVIVDVLGCVSS